MTTVTKDVIGQCFLLLLIPEVNIVHSSTFGCFIYVFISDKELTHKTCSILIRSNILFDFPLVVPVL